MKITTFKITEAFLLIALPVSLLVACNGDIDKSKDKANKAPSKTSLNTSATKTDLAAFEHNSLTPESVSSNLRKVSLPNEVTAPVTEKRDLEIVKVPTKRIINFSSNQFKLSASQKKLIKQHAQYLRYNPNSTLMISGYSDSVGPADLNYEISKKRAKSVFDEFKKQGIVENQLEMRAYGEAFALQTAKSGHDDRRVELDYVKHDFSTTALLEQ